MPIYCVLKYRMSRRILAIQFTEEEVAKLDAYCQSYPERHNGLKVARAAVIRMLMKFGWGVLREKEGFAQDEARPE